MGDFSDQIKKIQEQARQEKIKQREAVSRLRHNEMMYGTDSIDQSHTLKAARIAESLIEELIGADKTITFRRYDFDKETSFIIIRKDQPLRISIEAENNKMTIIATDDHLPDGHSTLEDLQTIVFQGRFDQDEIRESVKDASELLPPSLRLEAGASCFIDHCLP